MVKKIVINFEDLINLNLELNEYVVLFEFYNNGKPIPSEIKNILEDKGHIIKIGNSRKIISTEIRNYLNSTLIEDKAKKIDSDTAIQQIVNDRIDEYRDLWKGLKPGAMGSLKACKENLLKWLKNNPENNFDDILKAASLYISKLNNVQYLKRADYFIYKKEHGVLNSTLDAYISDIDNYEEDGWTTEIK